MIFSASQCAARQSASFSIGKKYLALLHQAAYRADAARGSGLAAAVSQRNSGHIKGGWIMAEFPKTEEGIIQLAQTMISGMLENADYPAPPVSAAQLQALLDEFVGAGHSQIAAYAAAEQSTQTKRVTKDALVAGMRADLNYAEYAVNGDDAKLNLIGWSGRMPPSPIPAPGQPLNFQVIGQSPGTVRLRWKRSAADGGTAAYFVIKRLGRNEGDEWTPVHTQTGVEAELTNQERGKELEYCVTAVNRSGESLPSNSVMVVL
jgi:hypothetical protein